MNEKDEDRTEERRSDLEKRALVDRYTSALHAMQSGVKVLQELGLSEECSPKHLRIGVNSALIESGVLAKLLMNKGIITENEYLRTLAELTEADVLTYEKRLEDALPGRGIKLV